MSEKACNFYSKGGKCGKPAGFFATSGNPRSRCKECNDKAKQAPSARPAVSRSLTASASSTTATEHSETATRAVASSVTDSKEYDPATGQLVKTSRKVERVVSESVERKLRISQTVTLARTRMLTETGSTLDCAGPINRAEAKELTAMKGYVDDYLAGHGGNIELSVPIRELIDLHRMERQASPFWASSALRVLDAQRNDKELRRAKRELAAVAAADLAVLLASVAELTALEVKLGGLPQEDADKLQEAQDIVTGTARSRLESEIQFRESKETEIEAAAHVVETAPLDSKDQVLLSYQVLLFLSSCSFSSFVSLSDS
jgi:hypothetical protein